MTWFSSIIFTVVILLSAASPPSSSCSVAFVMPLLAEELSHP